MPAANVSIGSPGWSYSYQIAALSGAVPIFVRVSATNSVLQTPSSFSFATPAWPLNSTTACSTMPSHCFAVPASQLLFIPVGPIVQLSPQQVANRLLVSWSQPAVDAFGFITLNAGNHTPSMALLYRIEWSTLADFSNSSYIDARMITGDGIALNCSGSCSVTLGEEVQNVTVSAANGEDLTAGSFILLYTGRHNAQVLLEVRENQPLVSVLDPNLLLVAVNDFLKIDGVLYQIANVSGLLNITLATPFAGGYSDVIMASYIPYPVGVLSYNATALQVDAYLSAQLIPGPIGPYANFTNIFDVSVDRLTYGRSFLVTFTGEFFDEEEDALVILAATNSSYSLTGVTSFGTLHSPVGARTFLSVNTTSKAGDLIPGVALFVRVMGINSVGIGASLVCSVPSNGNFFGALAPRSPPALPVVPLVYSIPDASGIGLLFITWGAPNNYGGAILSYTVEWVIASPTSGAVNWTGLSSVSIPQSSFVSNVTLQWTLTVVQGQSYSVRVRAFNDQGSSGPAWYLKVGSTYTTAVTTLADFYSGAQTALPTCVNGLDECMESSFTVILSRTLPGPANLTVPSPLQQVPAPAFTASSVMVYFGAPFPNGDVIDLYRVEWDEVASFTSPLKASVVVSNTYFNITGLAMGQVYYIRVFAHSSIGFGWASETAWFIPIQQPDPPSNLVLRVAVDAVDLMTYATSLNVSWTYPSIVVGGPDLVGDGGDSVTSYLVEWSRAPFSQLTPSIQRVDVTTPAANFNDSATFSLGLLYPGSAFLVNSSVSGFIPVTASLAEVKQTLENMPNIGSIRISSNTSGTTTTYLITFPEEAINVPLLTVAAVSPDFGLFSSAATSIVQNESFSGSFYSFSQVIAKAGEFNSNYLISNLLPGYTYFARVSAGNTLGYGRRRLTAPASLTVPLTQPSAPTQLEGVWGGPRVYLTSPTSVLLEIGAPLFDGGSITTDFTVEWDTSSAFDSSLDDSGSPLGQIVVPASQILCTACVTSIVFPSSSPFLPIVSYMGTSDTTRLLLPGVRISITTTDDQVPYTFTIGEGAGTPSSFTLLSAGSRLSTFNSSANGAASLLLLGAEVGIQNLTVGSLYFFRVSAENSMGICPLYISNCGAFVPTVPPSLLMLETPSAPSILFTNVISSQSVQVGWSSPPSTGSIISYRVDAFTRASAASKYFSFFGDNEIQSISTAATNVTGGTFTVSYDTFSVSLPGTVSAIYNDYFFSTSADLTPYVAPGDSVQVLGSIYTISAAELFTNTGFYVLERIQDANIGVNLAQISISARPRTVPIPFDADAAYLRNALQSAGGTGQVWVDRLITGAGFTWTITFLTNPGNVPSLVLNTVNLLGNNPTAVVSTILDGTLPNNYQSQRVTTLNATFLPLSTAQEWFFRVLATNTLGDGSYSLMESTIPWSIPSPPSSLTMETVSSTAIAATFLMDASENGSPVSGYFLTLQRAQNPSVLSNDSMVFNVALPVSYQVQQMTTAAHTLPFTPTSTFTLSVGSFYGVYNRYSGAGVSNVSPGFFDILSGASEVVRSTVDPSINHPHIEVSPGEFIMVLDQEFRVCLNQDPDFVLANGALTIDTIPICDVPTAMQAATIDAGYSSHTVYGAPVYRLDTSVGQTNSPLLGSSSIVIEFGDGALNLNATSSLFAGDWLSIGHPIEGEVFRILNNVNSVLSLGTVTDPTIAASISFASLQVQYDTAQFFIAAVTYLVLVRNIRGADNHPVISRPNAQFKRYAPELGLPASL